MKHWRLRRCRHSLVKERRLRRRRCLYRMVLDEGEARRQRLDGGLERDLLLLVELLDRMLLLPEGVVVDRILLVVVKDRMDITPLPRRRRRALVPRVERLHHLRVRL